MSNRNSAKKSLVGGGNERKPVQRSALVNNETMNHPYNTASRNATSGGATKSTKRAGSKKPQKNKVAKKSIAPARATAETEETEFVEPDPAEPLYCLCQQVSFGRMVCCDNDLCPRVWFHFSCVNLGKKPKGKWFCPKCRSGRSTTMKPRAQLIQELVEYNKEMEENYTRTHQDT